MNCLTLLAELEYFLNLYKRDVAEAQIELAVSSAINIRDTAEELFKAACKEAGVDHE